MTRVLLAGVLTGAAVEATATPAASTMPGQPGRLAFSRTVDDTGWQIFTMKVGGGNRRQLTESGSHVQPEWSPDGRRIAWVCRPDGSDDLDVCIMNADGSDQEQFAVTGHDRSPAFDPTGRYLAYTGSTAGPVPTIEIFVRDLDTGAVRQLTANEAAEAELTWSPDGTTIAFVTSYAEGGALAAVDVATGEERPILVTDGAGLGQPDWKPNGKRLVYWKTVRGGLENLFSISADGSRERQVTKRAVEAVSSPVWSPDGRHMAFGYGDGDGRTCIFSPRKVLDLQDFPLRADCTRGLRLDLSWQPRPPE